MPLGRKLHEARACFRGLGLREQDERLAVQVQVHVNLGHFDQPEWPCPSHSCGLTCQQRGPAIACQLPIQLHVPVGHGLCGESFLELRAHART
jgi:hypothetical protein